MSQDTEQEKREQEKIDLLREIRDGQREIAAVLSAHRELAEAQLRRSEERVRESVELQKEALRRQRSVTLIAVPGIVVCLAAISYLVLRFF